MAAPRATHAELAETLDIPPSLVNRYLKRLSGWGAVKGAGRARSEYSLTPKGEALLERASWEFLAFARELLERVRERGVDALRAEAGRGRRRAVLYGATPLAGILGRWAVEAGLEVVAVCDEERRGAGIVRLDDLAGLRYDVIILADWGKAEDKMLGRLLNEFGPVINPFLVDGAARPEWS